jgi:hypothetical protein
MLLEHLIYSAALALIVGIIFMHYTKRDPTWIIILMTIMPDVDYVVNKVMLAIGFNYPVIINHGDFHNLVGLTVFCVLGALVFHKFGVRFGDALLCSIIGYLAHFLEDYIVYPPAYCYFYPFSFRDYGINLIPETANLIVVGSEVLIPGIIIFCIALYLRKMYDGDGLAMHRYVIESIDFAKRIFVSKRYQEFL